MEEKAYILSAKIHSSTQGKLNDCRMREEHSWAPTAPCNEVPKSSTMNDGVGDYTMPTDISTCLLVVLPVAAAYRCRASKSTSVGTQ